MKKEIFLPIVVFLETFITYFLIIIPTEYFLTEKFLIIPTISNQIKTTLFISIFLIVFLLNYFGASFFEKSKKLLPLLVILFVASLFLNRSYSDYYSSLQDQPKIYKISSDWGIQAMSITITGKNFGSIWEKGEVRVDEVVMEVESWQDDQIVAHLPVPPRHFQGRLFVIGANGEKSNSYPFEIRNPDFLKGRH